MKIQNPIRYVLLLIFGGLLYLVIFIYQNIQRNKESFQWVTHTHEAIEDINAVRSAVLEIESQLRGYVITGNDVFITNYNGEKAALFQNIRNLKDRTADNAVQQRNCESVLALAKSKVAFQDEILAQFQTSPRQAQEGISGLGGKKITDSINAVLQVMQASEQQLLSGRMNHYNHLMQLRYITTLVIAIGAFIVLVILLLKIICEARLRRLAEEKALLNENKYKGLIENSALMVYATNLEGNFTYLSDKSKDFTGFSAKELIGENYLALVEESWQQRVQEFYQAQIKNQLPETILELPIVGKNGERRWIEQSVVLLTKNGEPSGFQSIAKDVTEKKYAENLLADAEGRIKAKQEEYQERLHAILDHMPMIIYLKDLEGRFILANRQFHQTFGTTDEDVIGKSVVDAHKTSRDSQRFMDADLQVKKWGKPVEIEASLMTTEGERDMLIIKFPLYDKNNELLAVSAVGKDITEVVRYQRQLIKAKKRAEKAERLQEEFLANMSHEIRTPMNGIIGMTNLLETTPLNAEQKDYLHLIKESSGILLNLINDILDLSKIKSGRMSVEEVDFDLHHTIESLVAPFRLKAKEKNIRLSKILQDVPQHIRGDQHKLQQVLNNLLSNAIKFTKEGAVTLFATTEERANGSLYLICTVSDTGIGIAQENLEHVFESFVQAGNDMVRRFGGTGLGLAITKRLVELMGGSITVSSTLGEGSSFYIELPVVPGEGCVQLSADVPEEKEEPTQTLHGKKILLIEDNLVNQKVTYLMLHKAGMEVDIANHGKEAVQLLQQKTYDLIITDLQMPEMDGFQTVAFVRNRLQLALPIIAMTASALRNEKDRCFALGMNEYLTKPFAPASLFFHLKRLLLSGDEKGKDAPAALPEAKTGALYNLSFLEEMEDDDYSAEVLDLFLTLTPQTLSEIKESTYREQWGDVHKKAHSLKSSLGILQMTALLQTVTDIEQKAKTGTETETIDTLLHQAIQQYNLVKPMLEAELETTRLKLTL